MQRRRILSESGRCIFEWAREKGRGYKGRGVFPLSLTDYYGEARDVEVAAIVECMVPNPMDATSTRRVEYITELHNLLGESPSRMVRERDFMHLLPHTGLDGLLGRMGIQKSDLFNLLDWIWEVQNIGETLLKVAFLESAGLRRAGGRIPDLHDGRLSHELNPCAVRLAMMRLCLTDGMGRNMWPVPADALPCPLDGGVRRMLRQLYPVGRFGEEDVDEILAYLGWDVPCEFVYVYLACQPYAEEMAVIGEKLRDVVDGKIGQATWHKSYGNGAALLPNEMN